jgi:hypothetical protein
MQCGRSKGVLCFPPAAAVTARDMVRQKRGRLVLLTGGGECARPRRRGIDLLPRNAILVRGEEYLARGGWERPPLPRDSALLWADTLARCCEPWGSFARLTVVSPLILY